MLKTIAQRLALVLALTVTAVPASRMHAQTASPSAVTGTDPQPPGEPPPPKPKVTSSALIAALILLGLA